MMQDSKVALNCSLLFTEHALLDRPSAARDAGYTAVEFWWPFSGPNPAGADVAAFIRAIDLAGVQLVAMNLFAGDMAAGDRGVLSHVARRAELETSLAAVREVAGATGVRAFNALHGRRLPQCSPEQQRAAAVDGLTRVADLLAESGGTVLLEAVSGVPDFPLMTFQDCVNLRDAVAHRGHPNVGVLADLYHLTVNGDDVDDLVTTRVQDIGHVQVADVPGRHEPGSGELPLGRWTAALRAGGYEGWIGLEYNPAAGTAAGLEHLAWV